MISLASIRRATRELFRSETAPQASVYQNSFRGGSIDRSNKNFQPFTRSADAAIAEAYDTLTGRAEWLGRNEPMLRKAISKIVQEVVGDGILCRASAKLNRDELDTSFNDEADELFDQWAEEEADVEGRATWNEIQQIFLREVIVSGEALLLRCYDANPRRLLPYCVQLVESQQIDSSRDGTADNGNRIRRGIELDKQNRTEAIYLFDAHPDGLDYRASVTSQRVPAERILHWFQRDEISQTRGISWLAPLVQPAKDRDFLTGAALTSAGIEALFTVAIKRASGAGRGTGFRAMDGTSDDTDENGNPVFRLGRAIVADLGEKDSIEPVESKKPGPNFSEFVKLLLLQEACGLNLSYANAYSDYSKTTYSSGRMGAIDCRSFYRPLQRRFGRGIIAPVYRDVITTAASLGQLSDHIGPIQFLQQRRRWLRSELQPPGWELVDPQKEVEAIRARLACGISTLQDECSALGKDWRKVLKQIALERKTQVELMGRELDYEGKAAAVVADPDQDPAERDPADREEDDDDA